MNVAAPALAPSSLSEADLRLATSYIQQTRDLLLGSVRLLTDAQWEFQPAPARWSTGQIVTHVITIQKLVLAKLQQGLADAPPPPPAQDHRIVDSIVIHRIPNRLTRFPSPIPVEYLLDKATAVRDFIENCEAFTSMLNSMPGLREHVLEAAPLRAISHGEYSVMDGYQWILAAAAHAERHAKQILEVIANATFPLAWE